jgi:EAL domain-containing protein (putative c-di-GMP-specific phosphodiesterase class I)/GGDEF domain-containing protein/CBS domain-containing protein
MNKIEEKNVRREQFMNILAGKQIRTVFQPIVSLRDGTIYGYEALSRGPSGSDMESPSLLFECAQRFNKLWELELLCRTKAIETVYTLSTKIRLFLNVNPSIMHDPKFQQGFTKDYLSQYSISAEDVIFEITEREAISNVADFTKTIRNYKDQNYKIAIDDAGAGYSGLNLISEVCPHFIKIDMNLIRDIDKDVTKQSLVKSMREFAALSNTYLIAEGIETEGELLKLIEIGVDFGQGYFIQRPHPELLSIASHVLQLICEADKQKRLILCNRLCDIHVGSITKSSKTILPGTVVDQILDMMKKDCTLPGFCVTENGVVIGVITRNDLFRNISDKYGYTLYANKPISVIMSKEFLCVDYQSSIDSVAKKAMHRHYDKIYDFITVTRDGKYFGVVTVKDLLEKSIEIEVINAKHLNPLSELPGNMLIEKQLETCIDSPGCYTILYFDIDNFKPYNDVYGFENGDRLIKCLAGILKDHIPKSDFIGHIGGDDFIAVLSDCNGEDLCKTIIEEFDKTILLFLNRNDIDKGYITALNRKGTRERFPILSISIVGTSSNHYKTIFALSENLARLKKICKQRKGSNYILE